MSFLELSRANQELLIKAARIVLGRETESPLMVTTAVNDDHGTYYIGVTNVIEQKCLTITPATEDHPELGVLEIPRITWIAVVTGVIISAEA